MPDPAPLDMPSGDPAAVEDLVRDTAGAAYRLAVLTDRLGGPAGSATRWAGADAVAAEAQLARVAEITRESADAVLTATGRLSAHAELLRITRQEVSALRAEQDEDFRTAWQRLGQIEDPQSAVMSGWPVWVGVVAELEAAEARRRRRHALVLEGLAHDAAATVRELAAAVRPLGATGQTGDGGRVLVHLAAELPGWGAPEMAHRGRALAQALLLSNERARLTGDAVHLAAHPTFATALVRELGVERFGLLLDVLGNEPDGPDHPLAAVLAAALGAAVPSGRPRDTVAAVLGAGYVRPDDRYGAGPRIAGMTAVLAAGTGSAGGGPGMGTVGSWARQLLLREQVQDASTEPVSSGMAWREDARDPVQLLLEVLARGGDPAAASALLGDDRVWAVLLDRFWSDGGTALGDVVAAAGRDTGPAGDRAVRSGLETIGAGLVEGDPSDRTVNRHVVAAVSPALGDAVAAHVNVAAQALERVATAGGEEDSGDLLKGLGLLTVNRRAATAVEEALTDWAGTQPHDLGGSSAAHPLPALAVPAAYLAVQEYGQRLAHALDGFELQEEAQSKEASWNWTAGFLLEAAGYLPFRPVAVVADVLGAYGPIVLDRDGTFEQGEDRGLRFDATAAGAGALGSVPPELRARADAVQAQSEASYRRTAGLLGNPAPPTSPEKDWVSPALDLLTGGMTDMATDELRDRTGRERPRAPFGGLPSGRR